MDSNTNCSICLAEYTTEGDHHIVALNCGHIFGKSCIHDWFGSKKSANCPTCTAKSLKRQIRRIYASSMVSLDLKKENDLIEKYLNEQRRKEEIIQENRELRVQIDYYKKELEKMHSMPQSVWDIHRSLVRKVRLGHNTLHSKVVYDSINDLIHITAFVEKKPNIITYGSGLTNTRSISNFDAYSKPISCIAMSPFNDNFILFSIENGLFLYNSCTMSTIFSCNIQNVITSCIFDNQDRNYVYFGDCKGYVYTMNLCNIDGVNKEFLVTNLPIHSMWKSSEALYVSTIQNIFKIEVGGGREVEDYGEDNEAPGTSPKDGSFLFSNKHVKNIFGGVSNADDNGKNSFLLFTSRKKISNSQSSQPNNDAPPENIGVDPCTDVYKMSLPQLKENHSLEFSEIFTNLSGENNTLMITMRNNTNRVSHYIFGDKELILRNEIKQIRRHCDKIYNGHLYLVNDADNSIRVLKIDNLLVKHVYRFNDPVVDFYVCERSFVVLTSKFVLVYG